VPKVFQKVAKVKTLQSHSNTELTFFLYGLYRGSISKGEEGWGVKIKIFGPVFLGFSPEIDPGPRR